MCPYHYTGSRYVLPGIVVRDMDPLYPGDFDLMGIIHWKKLLENKSVWSFVTLSFFNLLQLSSGEVSYGNCFSSSVTLLCLAS